MNVKSHPAVPGLPFIVYQRVHPVIGPCSQFQNGAIYVYSSGIKHGNGQAPFVDDFPT